MAKIIAVYRSISGFTKRYAEWIAEDLNADIYDAREVTVKKLSKQDLIIFGGSLSVDDVVITVYYDQIDQKVK